MAILDSPRKYSFSQVDAFTRTRFAGNPCAIILDADDLSDGEMLAIAHEMNLSETSFVLKSSKAHFRFRYFTPAEEIPLAGHPTIATVHRLIELGHIPPDSKSIQIELKAGIIEVRIEPKDKGILIAMKQLRPQFLKTYSDEVVLEIFALTKGDLIPGAPIQTVSTGTPMLMIPIQSAKALARVEFDAQSFTSFREASDFFSAHLFCLEGFTSRGDTYARHFTSPPDVIEDPFTGSATGAMACYLWKYAFLRKEQFIAEQGHALSRPGEAYVKVLLEEAQIQGVEVAGYAVTSMQGELFV